ncbi:superoxide dismutase family protein [Jannaschia formosa]|uniref:superoxide dismutase family protein n=1 Tax=Jannaschia formosa TaxID=2259592 RepID=UPI000E1BFE81|nr:superoxide dismutase family protein [Jannaschia formosa]TFL17802.1 superoxide dismutase family protein [Jannaschia formosa]
MRILPALSLALVLPVSALANNHVTSSLAGNLVSADGSQIGSVAVIETASGVIRVAVQGVDVTPGAHGVHLHETGVCEGDFSSAGGHIAGDANHGLVEGGPHPGDLPNALVGEDGELSMEAFANANLTMDMLRDDDLSALIVHSGPDDYISQPSGDSGSRIACAVLDAVPAAAEN